MNKEPGMALGNKFLIAYLAVLVLFFGWCVSPLVRSQDSHHADLPAGEIPDPYQLYQRLAKDHSLPSIAANSAEKYKELLKNVDPELLNKLSPQQKHDLRKMANSMLSKADSQEQIEQLGGQFEKMQSQFQAGGGTNTTNPSSNSNSLQNLVDKIKNGFNPSENGTGDEDSPVLPFSNQSGSGGGGRSGTSSGFSGNRDNGSSNNDSSTPKTRLEFNRKMNRLLFNAAKSSLENGEVGDGSTPASSGSSFSWQSLVDRLAESAKEHIDDPSLKTRYGRNFKSIINRMKNATSSSRFYNRFESSSGNLSQWSPSSVGTWIVFLALAGIAFGLGFVYLRNRDPEKGGNERARPKPSSLNIPVFSTNSQLVNSVDEITCWICNSDARWWNARQLERFLVQQFPAERLQIKRLMRYYEKARYQNPGTSLSKDEFYEANLIATQLVAMHANAQTVPAEMT